MLTIDHVITVTLSLIFYSILIIIYTSVIKRPQDMESKEYRDYIGQHISLTHSVIACILSLIVYIQDNGIDYESTFNYRYLVVFGHSMGYFAYDMIYAEIFGVHDLAMRFHHVCVLIGGTMFYTADNGGSVGILCIALTELSNPCMQVRLILKARKQEENLLYKISEIIFASVFIFNR